MRLINKIDRSPRKNVASLESVEAAADRNARTKMMTTLFYRVSSQSAIIHRRIEARGFSRSRDIRRETGSCVFSVEFLPRAADRKRETNDAEDPRKRVTKCNHVCVDARRKTTTQIGSSQREMHSGGRDTFVCRKLRAAATTRLFGALR